MEIEEKIVIIDFGSQYTHLLSRRIRELGVYSEIIWPKDAVNLIEDKAVKGIIFSGGPMSVYDTHSPKISSNILGEMIGSRVPLLGVCYGHQLIAGLLDGEVREGTTDEYGKTRMYIVNDKLLFKDIPSSIIVWMSHKDVVLSPPKGFEIIAYTDSSPVAAMADFDNLIFGVQFHPEVVHTEHGKGIIRNFVIGICGCSTGWDPIAHVNSVISSMKGLKGLAVAAVSGGVDSTVSAYIAKSIFGERLHVIFINTGLLRDGEADETLSLLNILGFHNIHYVDAENRFLTKLRGIEDPEEKRRVISELFAEVLNETVNDINRAYGKVSYIIQGTLYPDRVESGVTSPYSDKIKSHHNVVMPDIEGIALIEPLKDLYKDEVRVIAKALNLPEGIVKKHPFPGPGLAIRIVGEVTSEKLEILRKADRVVHEEMSSSGLYDRVWQAFPVLLSLKSVGIKGDRRSYEYIIALRVVNSTDAMTASFARIDWELLDRISTRITNEVEGVNRVLYDITNKPPATIEFE